MTRTAPTGLTRWLLRAPIGLYRARLGFLMGHRFVLIHHTGRVSGRPRDVVVEVVREDGDSVVVCSGWGEGSQWFQNVMAHPDVVIEVASSRREVRGRQLSPDEGEAEMLDYARRHPSAARRLSGYMGFPADGRDETYREVGRSLPFVRFDPR